jgi:acetyl esterase/lipase
MMRGKFFGPLQVRKRTGGLSIVLQGEVHILGYVYEVISNLQITKNVLFLLILTISVVKAQNMEVQLYEGMPSGSENWTWKEGINNKNSLGVMTVYNVAHPTLTIFSPNPETSNGTAVIVCPGGGFHFLAIDHEGANIANMLTKKGITVFVLKYRLVHILSDNPFDDMLNAADKKAWDDESLPIIPLAIADGRQALEYVRNNAAQYKIDPKRIGIMGFSAGGMVAAATAFEFTFFNRPDFIVPIYGDLPESILGSVREDAPPLFILCAQDDEFGFALHAIRMYNKWYAARRPAEMHLFSRGGHGFGMGDPTNTTQNWIDRFSEWLVAQKLMISVSE